MNVSEFQSIAHERLGKLEDLLKQLYGIQLDWSCSEAELQEVLEHYEGKRAFTLTENSAYGMANAEYTKFVLITEAIRLFLTEIAPKRRKQQRRK